MKKTLFSHLFIYILSGSILVIGLFSLMTFQIAGDRFDDYLSDRFLAEREEVVESIESAYLGDNTWDKQLLDVVLQNAMHNHIVLRLEDSEGDDIISQESSPRRQHMRGMRMGGLTPGEDWLEEEVTLEIQGEQAGTLFLTYPGIQSYSAEEEGFLEELMWLIFMMGVLSVVIAVLLAYLISKRLSRPIAETSQMTQALAKGERITHTSANENIRELASLHNSVMTLAEQLEQQKQIRDQLASDLAHEVRTPLTALQGNIEAMIDGVWEATPERLISLNNQVKRLTHLVQLIDQLETTDAASGKLAIENVKLKELVETSVLAFEQQANEKAIRMSYHIPNIIIEADKNKLAQVLTNLLVNAIKFTPEKGSITVDAKEEKDTLLLTVRDTGMGIPPENQPFVFERFYQVEPSRNSELSGQGIGLAVVKSIIEAHQGSIELNSQMGQGTAFIIRLPLKQ
ncbi:HAMP domain-containing sensor histidine kinase [Alkalibacterium psychrotolerans]